MSFVKGGGSLLLGRARLSFLSRDQGWVGSQLRLWLPEAGLFAKMLASRPALASKHSKVVGFGLGFSFLKCCF